MGAQYCEHRVKNDHPASQIPHPSEDRILQSHVTSKHFIVVAAVYVKMCGAGVTTGATFSSPFIFRSQQPLRARRCCLSGMMGLASLWQQN